eukprot:470440_1
MLSLMFNLLLSTSAIVAIIFLAFCSLVHFGSHFTFRKCLKTRKSNYSSRRILPNKTTKMKHNNNSNNNSNEIILEHMYSRCICQKGQNCIIPVDEENFDFFPVSFVSYILFIIIITSLILYKLYTTNNNEPFRHNIHKFNASNISLMAHNKYDIIDWILTYSMIILSIWDSLFSFYRYYTTMYCAVNFSLVSIKTTIKYFSVYAIPYFIIYILQIHIYYYLYPILILSHGIMNFWSTWMFSKILIDSTMQYYKTEKMIENAHDDMLKSVYFMRNTSIVWCLISFICQIGFVVTANIQIIYFYPIFWCIGCIIFSLNFVRNRSKIYETSFKIYQIFKHCKYCGICIKNRNNNYVSQINQSKTLKTPSNNTPQTLDKQTDINKEINDEHSIENNIESTAKSTDITLTKSSNTHTNSSKLTSGEMGTHNMMDSIDENDQIGDIDVFADEDEIIYSIYDDPISVMALNRNNSNKKRLSNNNLPRESMIKIINKDNKKKHQLNPTLNLSILSEFNDMSVMSVNTNTNDDTLYDDEDYEYQSEDEEQSKKKTNKALEILGITASIPKRITLVKNQLDPKKSSKSKVRKKKLMEDIKKNYHLSLIKKGKKLKHNNNLKVIKKMPNLSVTRQRVRSLSTEDLPDNMSTKLNLNKYSQSAFEMETINEWSKIKLNLRPSHSENMYTYKLDEKKENINYKKPNDIINEHKVEMEKFTMEITNKLRMIQRKSEFGGGNVDMIRRLEYENQHRVQQPKLDVHRSVSEPNSPKRLQQFFGGIKNKTNSPYSASPESDYIKMMNEQEEEITIVVHNAEEKTNNLLAINKNIDRLKLENALSAPMLTPVGSDEYIPKHTPRGHRKTPSQGNTPIGNLSSIVELINNENKKDNKLPVHLNVLVLQGFYSRKSLNSVQQLTEYNNNTNSKSKLKTIHE